MSAPETVMDTIAANFVSAPVVVVSLILTGVISDLVAHTELIILGSIVVLAAIVLIRQVLLYISFLRYVRAEASTGPVIDNSIFVPLQTTYIVTIGVFLILVRVVLDFVILGAQAGRIDTFGITNIVIFFILVFASLVAKIGSMGSKKE
jgi:hypothetical protein